MSTPKSTLTIGTPIRATADFCLLPVGTSSPSVSRQIADVQKLMKSSGLNYTMHSAGTTVGGSTRTLPWVVHLLTNMGKEGTWDEVTRVIGQAHSMLHEQGIVRVHTDIRIGSRTDKTENFKDKVTSVESHLAKDAEADQ